MDDLLNVFNIFSEAFGIDAKLIVKFLENAIVFLGMNHFEGGFPYLDHDKEFIGVVVDNEFLKGLILES